jgi:hypothetical protein
LSLYTFIKRKLLKLIYSIEKSISSRHTDISKLFVLNEISSLEVALCEFFATDDIALMYNKLVYCIPDIKESNLLCHKLTHGTDLRRTPLQCGTHNAVK